jgi:hypothetical protein
MLDPIKMDPNVGVVGGGCCGALLVLWAASSRKVAAFSAQAVRVLMGRVDTGMRSKDEGGRQKIKVNVEALE